MLKVNNENYLLSPIIDHKQKHAIGEIELIIQNDYENNLRTRNCQLGIVECLSKSNELNLSVGDTVFVHHFTFQGDIGQNRSFTEKEHIQYDGKDLYPVMKDKIFFKYNNEEIEPLGSFVIVEEVLTDEQTPSGIFLEQKPYKDRGRVIYALNGDLLGEVVLIENHALYPLEIKGKNYYRIYENEIAAFVTTGEVKPSENRILVVDHDLEAKSSLLDLSFMAKPNTTKSTIVSVGKITHKMWNWAKIGETILRYAGSHIEFEGVKIVNLEQDRVVGIITKPDL